MKIKNMKLMLLGLIGLMSASNASAAVTAVGDKVTVDGVTYEVKAGDVKKDETGRSVNGVVYDLYTVKWTALEGSKTFETKEAYAQCVNSAASAAEVATIAIPAEVKGDKGDYQVVEVKAGWETAAKDVTKATTSLSIDVTNFKAKLVAAEAFNKLEKLEALTITDANAAKDAKTVQFDGSGAKCKTTLKTLNLTGSNINEIVDNGLAGYTALTGFDFGTNIKTVGDNAFDGCYGITELTIPETVEKIGANAFANMSKKGDNNPETGAETYTGLKKLTFNAYSVKDKGFDPIPAVFDNDKALEEVIITSSLAKSIAAGAFVGDAYIKKIDLSGMTALVTPPDDAFNAALNLTSLKLAGTKLTTVSPSVDYSSRTLSEITFPAKLGNGKLPLFRNFIALNAIDLSGTEVTVIPAANFAIVDEGYTEIWNGGRQAYHWENKAIVWEKDNNGNPIFIKPTLTTVTLNAKTATIEEGAFAGQSALATVNNLNQGELATIGRSAFWGTALETVDLSATKLTTISWGTFGETSELKTVVLSNKINKIEDAAFLHAKALTSINLDATKIAALNNIFTDPWDYDVDNAPVGLTTIILPSTLKVIKQGALQGTGIEEIEIPSSVQAFGVSDYTFDSEGNVDSWSSYTYGSGVLQGCLSLKKFTWIEALVTGLPMYTFKGDTNLEEVTFFTLKPISGEGSTNYDGLTDNHFFMCSDVLVFVSAESYEKLIGLGYTPENSKYSILVGNQEKEFEFNEKGLAADGYYYKAIRTQYGSWFPADEFEVFVAAVEGDKVNLKAGEVYDGYYKIPANRNIIVRSKNIKGSFEVKAIENNTKKNNSIEKYETSKLNHLRCYGYDGSDQPGKLKYIYRLGAKNGVVAFYRITSGKFTNGQIYINAIDSKKDRLDITIDGIEIDATAIFGVETATEDSNAPIYNMQGMRVKTAQKGLYIQDGKKFIKK